MKSENVEIKTLFNVYVRVCVLCRRDKLRISVCQPHIFLKCGDACIRQTQAHGLNTKGNDRQ